ncbi:hypothetical protein J2Y67_003719 [Neobacillus niacini]|nr:hypothetical protein [Neobacillus niacini]
MLISKILLINQFHRGSALVQPFGEWRSSNEGKDNAFPSFGVRLPFSVKLDIFSSLFYS